MLKISKVSDKSILVSHEDTEYTLASRCEANGNGSDSVTITSDKIAKSFTEKYTNIEVDGVVHVSEKDCVDALNQFIGNFKTAGGGSLNNLTQDGNTLGVPVRAGSTNAQPLELITNGVRRATVTAVGNVEIGDPTEDSPPIYKLNVKGRGKIENGDHTLTVGNSYLCMMTSRNKFGGWLGIQMDSDESGAGGGIRLMHRNNIKAQIISGSPAYPFANGLTFDIPAGHIIHSVRGGGEVRIVNTNNASAQPAFILNPTTKRFIAGDTSVDSGATVQINAAGHSQLQLAQAYTPSSSSDANGVVGSFAWDDGYMYVKTTAGWKRSALTTF